MPIPTATVLRESLPAIDAPPDYAALLLPEHEPPAPDQRQHGTEVAREGETDEEHQP